MGAMNGLRAVTLLSLGLTATILAGCAGAQRRRTPAVPVVVAKAEKRTIPYEIEATGTVEPIQSADVTAQVGGLVRRVDFAEGDEVRAGQVLFRIDPRPFAAAVERAAAVLARDRAQHETARLELVRAERLVTEQLVAQAEVEQKRADASALAATARADSAALAAARLDLANATIRAPIAGKTGSLAVHVGDLVRANDTAVPLVTINRIRPVRVRFTVPQADLAELRGRSQNGLRVDVAPAEDSTWIEGRLTFVDNAVDPASGTLLLKGEFTNAKGELWPGAFVRVRLRLYEQADATVVPSAAVANSQSGSYLYVVKPDTTVEARQVQVRRTWRDLAIIASGVAPGETVVTDGQLKLSPGAKATIREAAVGATP
jgi:multidrug efflux system membrane fusion protein